MKNAGQVTTDLNVNEPLFLVPELRTHLLVVNKQLVVARDWL